MQENGFFHKLFRFLKEWLRKLLQVLFPADILTQIGHAAGEGSRRRNSDSDDLPIGAEPGEVTEEERKRMMETPVERRHIRFFGRVQGVGFRYHAMYSARNFNLTGWVANRSDGSVEMEVQGPEAAIDYIGYDQLNYPKLNYPMEDVHIDMLGCETANGYSLSTITLDSMQFILHRAIPVTSAAGYAKKKKLT